jgi:hypothetical protein
MGLGTFYPGSPGDDGYWRNPGVFDNSSDFMIFGDPTPDNFHTFVTLKSVTVPHGAVVVSAYTKFTCYQNTGGITCNCNIYGVDADDATPPSNLTEALALPLTSAVAAWNAIPAWVDGTTYNSPELKTILQEIFDRDNWESGNDLIIVIKDNSSSSGASREPSSINYSSGSEKAELHIIWSDKVTAEPIISSSVISASTKVSIAVEIIQSSAVVSVSNIKQIFRVVPSAITSNSVINAVLKVMLTRTPIISVSEIFGPQKILLPSPSIESLSEISINRIWDGAAWAAWLAEYRDKVSRKYILTLTGAEDGMTDVEIPYSSFQCRRKLGAFVPAGITYAGGGMYIPEVGLWYVRDPSPTYLSVTINNFDYAEQIFDRQNGQLKIDIAYEFNGVVIYQDNLITVDLEEIRTDQGGESESITLTGRKSEDSAAKSIELQNIVYQAFMEGKYRYRCVAPDLYINPGDTVIAGENSFIVDQIQYIVSDKYQFAEFRED